MDGITPLAAQWSQLWVQHRTLQCIPASLPVCLVWWRCSSSGLGSSIVWTGKMLDHFSASVLESHVTSIATDAYVVTTATYADRWCLDTNPIWSLANKQCKQSVLNLTYLNSERSRRVNSDFHFQCGIFVEHVNMQILTGNCSKNILDISDMFSYLSQHANLPAYPSMHWAIEKVHTG